LLKGLARIVRRQGKLCDIDEVGFNTGALAQFPGERAACRLMQPILAVPKITGILTAPCAKRTCTFQAELFRSFRVI